MAITVASIVQMLSDLINTLANYLMPLAVKVGVDSKLLLLIFVIIILAVIGIIVIARMKKSKMNIGIIQPEQVAPETSFMPAQQTTPQGLSKEQTKAQILNPYVQKNLDRGVSEREIYDALLKVGWHDDVVRESINEVRGQRYQKKPQSM